MSPFVHLHTHSQYSLLEASPRIPDLLDRAKGFGMESLALTDLGNMFGGVEFYMAAQKAGLKPLIGTEVYLAPGDLREKKGDPSTYNRLVLLAQTYKGYQNLCRLSSLGYKEGFYYKPRVDWKVLKEFSGDIIALTGGVRGEVARHFLKKGPKQAIQRLQSLQDIFQDRLYLEVQRTGIKEWEELEPFLFEVSKTQGVPLVATNEVYYLEKGDQLAQEVLVCIGTNKTLQNENRGQLETSEFYFKSSQQMYDLFEDCPQLCQRTKEVADRCHFEFSFKDEKGKVIYHLPSFSTKKGVSLEEEIRNLTYKGLKDRFKEALDKEQEVLPEDQDKYYTRLNYELSVIKNMGFIGYFLIVQDFICWAKNSGVPVGPGRGSGAGSVVAWSLNITDLDPVKYNLIFERFLNPERVSMPDFDIDFCQEERPRVIKYVTEKYGHHRVSQIITFGKLQARAALRDVGRVLAMSYSEVDAIVKLVPDKLDITLNEALKIEPRIKEQMEVNPQVDTLLNIALKVEGLVRNASIHAAGIIISDAPLVDHAPLYRGKEGENVIQYDMKHAEKIGLIKFDFLGLKTLTHIHYTLSLIQENKGNIIEAHKIPIHDPEIYKLMSEGDSGGIFQFESDGITDALKKIKPTCFEDIMAINALYRPGPMDRIPEYTKRKQGLSPVEYIFPELEEILKETYGIIIYQEQVQFIASKIASYSLGEADLLRRAMGKKITKEMQEHRKQFVERAIKNGYNEKKSKELFDLMSKFAEYGFNKSHSAAYCVLAAQTGWLKAHYPLEFYAGLISNEMNDTNKVVKYIKMCRQRGIDIQPPHVNFSDYKFTVKGETLYYSLVAIKGVGHLAALAIKQARNSLPNKKFSSLEEFFDTVDLRRVNKKVVESLIKAGALDHFGYSRSQIFKGFEKFVDSSELKRQDMDAGQISLFSLNPKMLEQIKILLPEDLQPWRRMTRLLYEKEVLGFYLSHHPLQGYERICRAWANVDIKNLGQCKHKNKVRVVAMVSEMREVITKKGTRMAFAQIEDLTGLVEAVIFPDVFSEFESLLKQGIPVIVSGVVNIKGPEGGKECKIIVDKIMDFYSSLQSVAYVKFKIQSKMESHLDRLKERIEKNPGSTPVHIELDLDNFHQKVFYQLKTPKGVDFCDEFLEDLQKDFGHLDFIDISLNSQERL